MKRKIVSAILTVLMLLVSVPLAAFSENFDNDNAYDPGIIINIRSYTEVELLTVDAGDNLNVLKSDKIYYQLPLTDEYVQTEIYEQKLAYEAWCTENGWKIIAVKSSASVYYTSPEILNTQGDVIVADDVDTLINAYTESGIISDTLNINKYEFLTVLYEVEIHNEEPELVINADFDSSLVVTFKLLNGETGETQVVKSFEENFNIDFDCEDGEALLKSLDENYRNKCEENGYVVSEKKDTVYELIYTSDSASDVSGAPISATSAEELIADYLSGNKNSYELNYIKHKTLHWEYMLVKAVTQPEPSPIPSPSLMLGDLNNDNKTTVVDAKWILQSLAGIRTLDGLQTASADINGDGKISVVDAKRILQSIADLKNSPLYKKQLTKYKIGIII